MATWPGEIYISSTKNDLVSSIAIKRLQINHGTIIHIIVLWINTMLWRKELNSLLQLKQMKLPKKSTHVAVLFRLNLVKVVWQLVAYPERIFSIVISFRKNKEGGLMVMCLVQLINLHTFHKAVWKSLGFPSFKVRSM